MKSKRPYTAPQVDSCKEIDLEWNILSGFTEVTGPNGENLNWEEDDF